METAVKETGPDTRAVRGGLERSAFSETAEAIYLTSGFVYESAAEAEAAFAGDVDRYIYSRYGNPTVSIFEERLRQMEGAEACFATASGMSAVFTALAGVLSAGDRVVAARGLFGSCFMILDQILPRWNITTEFVDGPDLGQWERALATPAQAVFFETPSNPMLELIDIRAVAELAHDSGALVMVDNVFASPVLQRPLDFDADVTIYSATKHIDGQGRTLGGAILGPKSFIDEKVQPMMRHTGPSMSPFNAWVLAKALETLRLRVSHQSESALHLARVLQDHAAVDRVWYPMLESHPQVDLARRQMTAGGTVVTFEVPGGKNRAFQVLDRMQMIDISNNLGDSKSLVTHPASTTHRRLGPEVRAAMGITEGVVRISVGLEDIDDIVDDVTKALS